MAWYLVKHKDNFNIYLYLEFDNWSLSAGVHYWFKYQGKIRDDELRGDLFGSMMITVTTIHVYRINHNPCENWLLSHVLVAATAIPLIAEGGTQAKETKLVDIFSMAASLYLILASSSLPSRLPSVCLLLHRFPYSPQFYRIVLKMK
jgi:hypothetical protein